MRMGKGVKDESSSRAREGGCAFCRNLPTYNKKTLRALAACDREIENDLSARAAGRSGTMKAYTDLDALLRDLHSL